MPSWGRLSTSSRGPRGLCVLAHGSLEAYCFRKDGRGSTAGNNDGKDKIKTHRLGLKVKGLLGI